MLRLEPTERCFSCNVVTKDELKKLEFVHEPAINNCVGCHDGHGANNAKMLKAETPQLCYPCHEDIKEIAESSKYQHGAVSKQDGCSHCHTPHASTVQYRLKDTAMTLCMSCHDKPQQISKDEVLPAFTNELEVKEFLHGPVAENVSQLCCHSYLFYMAHTA